MSPDSRAGEWVSRNLIWNIEFCSVSHIKPKSKKFEIEIESIVGINTVKFLKKFEIEMSSIVGINTV